MKLSQNCIHCRFFTLMLKCPGSCRAGFFSAKEEVSIYLRSGGRVDGTTQIVRATSVIY